MPVATQSPPIESIPAQAPAVETPAEAEPRVPTAPADRLYRLTLDEYHRLADADILDDDRVELIGGLLVKKMTKKTPHLIATEYLDEVLHRVAPAGWYASMQNPISVAEVDSEPEPDGKLVRGSRSDYEGRRVLPADVGLVVEVADSSVRDDQVLKKAIYARSSIPTYWIVNIPARRVEVYTDPTGSDPSPDYRRRDDHTVGDVFPLMLDGREVAQIAAADLLPRN